MHPVVGQYPQNASRFRTKLTNHAHILKVRGMPNQDKRPKHAWTHHPANRKAETHIILCIYIPLCVLVIAYLMGTSLHLSVCLCGCISRGHADRKVNTGVLFFLLQIRGEKTPARRCRSILPVYVHISANRSGEKHTKQGKLVTAGVVVLRWGHQHLQEYALTSVHNWQPTNQHSLCIC